jgi:ubiquinone/menaquinone biosynthesis C-methylase UbiE
MKFLKKIIDKLFSNPILLNFVRAIFEGNYTVSRKIISNELDKNKKTLDIGCGTGEHSILFDSKQYNGIDISKKYVYNAKKRHKSNFFVMDAQNIRFPDNSFDNILILGILHHVNDEIADNILKEAKRLSKSNTKILIMEDIPVTSKINIIGKLMHYLDTGRYIRKIGAYEKIISKQFNIKKQFKIINGISDYCVFVCRNKK